MHRFGYFFLSVVAASAALADESTPGQAGAPGCRVVHSTVQANELASWSGACKDGYADGTGVLEWFRDNRLVSRYEGELKRGMRDGAGSLSGSTGDRYQGGWKANRPEGTGTIAYLLGGQYEGQWKNGRYDGKGVIVYAGGRRFEGEFADGAPVGQARRAEPAPTKQHFELKADDAPLGSSIKRDVVKGSDVPYNKAYDELTREQKQAVRARYPLLAEDDEPPYPLHGTEQIYRLIGKAQAKLRAEGTLSMQVQVDQHGKASAVMLFGAPDAEMSKFASLVLMQETYKPALCAGQPCAMGFPFSLKFERR
jgi:hypothetical protein